MKRTIGTASKTSIAWRNKMYSARLGVAVLFFFMLASHENVHAQAQVKLHCGKLGPVTLSNQFTLITYGDGNSSKRVAAPTPGTAGADGTSNVRFADGTVMSLRAGGGSGYAIQKDNGGLVACTRR